MGNGRHDEPEDQAPDADETGERIAPVRYSKPVPRSDGVLSTRRRINTGVRQAVGEGGTGLLPPAAAETLSAVLSLASAVSVDMSDREIIATYMETLVELFPARRFAIRLVAVEGDVPALSHTNDTALPGRDRMLDVSKEALVRHGLHPEQAEEAGFTVLDSYEPIFETRGDGFDVPMVAMRQLIGVLTVEYPRGYGEPDGEREIVVPLAHQVAVALRNARLYRESRYLRDYLEKLLDHANAPIIVIGREREIRAVNRAFLGITRLDREDLLGKDFIKLLPDEESSRLLPVLIHALRGEPTSNHEVKLPRAGGGHARVAINTASVMNSRGRVEAVIAIGRDLTEVRELEEQIIQAEKLATLGQLAAGVVHELNNPLTSISVYSDYLLKKQIGDDHDPGDIEKLRRIVQSADRILRFTRDLVTYARPSSEEPRLVSIHEVVDQAMMFCDHVVAETGTSVTKTYDEAATEIYAVKGQLHQVFINLITNACHAMPEGAGRLRVQTELEGDFVCIRIADNGVGVAPDQLERIFEPFFSTKGEGKGTGLGLSIVRNIIQQHNGTIEVTSELGGGTTFAVRLPCGRLPG